MTSESFDLTNGPGQIAAFLEVVSRVEEYPDSLEVTDPGPLIDYIRSITEVSDHQLESIRSEVLRVIQNEGSFHIDKQAGLITAIRS